MPDDVIVKRCSRCRRQAPYVHFSRNRAHEDGLQNYCDACRKPLWRKWWHDNKSRDPDWLKKSATVLRRNVLARKIKQYGLTTDQYEALAAKGCAICGG